MARCAPARLWLVRDADVVMLLALAARFQRASVDEVKVFSISGDVGVSVLKLAGERRDLRLRPATVLVARNEDGPPREIGRHLEKVYLAAIRCERWVRFIVASRNDAGRKQRRTRERLRRIVRGGLRNPRCAYDRQGYRAGACERKAGAWLVRIGHGLTCL